MLKYSHPDLALLANYWPLMVFLPLVLLMVVVLATVTHFWDQRDDEARRTNPSLANRRLPAADPVAR